ncbi:hypothetical protein [Pseudothermotoga sp.]|uniref:hypothetical protein n=1 Tax=Pseudothermotoga sp. TaxID=2033661 RepID=UPI0031F6C02B
MIDLAGMIRNANARITVISHREETLPVDIEYVPSSWLVEEDLITAQCPKKVIFVDSRRRRYASIEVEGCVILLSQVVTGAVLLEKDRCVPLFSPDDPPMVNLVLGMPEFIANLWGLSSDQHVMIGNLVCDVAVGLNAKDATDLYMQEIEKKIVERFLPDALVIKDGAIDFATPTFLVEHGPIGLVKNIHKAYVDRDKFKVFSSMKKGQRSKCIAIELGYGTEYLKIMTYLKLSSTPGLRGLVRIETVIEKDRFERVKNDVFATLAGVCDTLIKVSDDSGLIPRAPEDTLPMVFLERYLDQYFYNETYVKCALIQSINSGDFKKTF